MMPPEIRKQFTWKDKILDYEIETQNYTASANRHNVHLKR